MHAISSADFLAPPDMSSDQSFFTIIDDMLWLCSKSITHKELL